MHTSQDKPLRILVIRLSAMGDVAMCVPVVASLRQHYPEAHITMLTPAFLHPFFRDIEGVEFFAPDFLDQHKGITGIFRLSRELGNFDVVADLHDVIRTKMLRRIFRFHGARVAFIDKGRKQKKELVALEDKKLIPLKPTIERYRDVFLALGFELPPITPPVRKRHEMSPETAAIAGSRDQKRWIGIAPFAQHEGKIYPTELMEKVIARLSTVPDTQLFIFGGGTQEKIYADMMESRYPHVTSVIGRIRLGQEMELISQLDLMVSMDSSAMHMASLVGVPVVSVWGATHPYAGFYGMGQDPLNAIQLDMPCRPCSIYGNKPCSRGNYPCMHGIDPEQLLQRIFAVLNLPSSAQQV